MGGAACILLGGGTASGKTTIARLLTGREGWRLFPIDSYYRDLGHLPEEVRAHADFDNPAAIEWKLLLADLDLLLAGVPIEAPSYDYSTQLRTPRALPIHPGEVVVVEGIFALVNRALLERARLRVYVEMPDDLRLVRRLNRDVYARRIPFETVLDQWVKIVRPSHQAFVEPSKRVADLIVAGWTPPKSSAQKIIAALG